MDCYPDNSAENAALILPGKLFLTETNEIEKLAQQRRYLYAKLARIRRCQHQELANRFLACGDSFFVETMNFRGLAKKAKPEDKEAIQPGKKLRRRKRFGKSLANKAPAMFLRILEQKALSWGGSFQRINTWRAKASQYNHMNRQYNKKKLSQRWNIMPDRHKVQRDMYSAFLIMNTNVTLDGFDQNLCDSTYTRFLALHDKELQRLREGIIHMPSSAGIRRR